MLTDELYGDLTNIDYLISHVIDHIEGVSDLIRKGDDPSHAIKVLLAKTRFTQRQFRDQYLPKGKVKQPVQGDDKSAPRHHPIPSDACMAFSAPSARSTPADNRGVVGANGVYMDYRGRHCETCDDD